TGGTFYQSGGSASIGTLALGSKAGGTGGSATLTLVGGTFTNSNFARLCLGTDTAAMTIGGTADVTLPAFPTTRGSGSTVTLAFDGGTLRPYAASAAYLSNLTQVTLTANGANFNVDSNKNITIPQALEDAPSEAGILTKAGAGTLTLTGANAYSGGTVASEGTLLATSLGRGNVAVASGAKLGAGAGNAVATLSVGGDLTLNNSELLFDINSVLDGDKIQVAGALTPTGVTTITLSNVIPLANGDYTLLEVTGALGGSPASFTVASPSPKTYSIIYQTGSPNRVILQVSGPIASKSWLGDGVANQWDINTSLNWVETGSTVPLIAYQDNDAVLFDDTTTNLNVDITTTVSPASVTVISTNSYTFSGAGAIAGTNSLVKNGSGTLRIANANSYAGGTTLQGPAGTQLALANSAAIGTGPLALKSSVTSSAVTVVLANGITVTNAIVMDSTTGREAFLSTNGNNTLSGPITITGAGNNHLYFNNSGDPGSLLAISNSISGPAHTGGISFRGLAGNYGLVAGQVNIAGVFQLNGAATWTVASTNNSWTTTIIQGANGGFTLGDNDALATTAKVNWGNDTSGALDLAGFNQTIAGLDCAVTPNKPTVGNSSTNSDSLLKINGGGYTFVGQLVDTLGAGTKKLSIELLSGTQTLSGTNTYTGSTTISGGTLTEGATGFIADTSPLTINGVSAVFNLGASHNDTVGTVTLANGAITGSGTSTLTVNTGGTFEMQNGTVTGVTLGGAVALNKTTSGTLVISKAIAYTGGTTISDGVLQSGVANVFGADPGKNVVINSPGILDVNGKGTYINSLSGDGTVDNTAATGLTLQLGRNNGGGTFSGLIQNSGGGDLTLWKWGTGTVTLGGTNTYSGYTWCIAGVLSVNSISSYSSPAPSALGQPTNATGGLIKMVNNGGTGNATLRYTGPTATTDRPIDLTGSTGGGILDASGTGPITFTSDFAASGAGSKSLTLTGTNTDANTIAGKIVDNSAVNTTALVKAGVGTWVIGANQDYTGGTIVNNGTLVVNGTLLSSANAVTVAGGTLSGNGTIAGPVAVNAGATLAPGNGLGVLTINNTLTLDAASTTAIELNADSNSSDLMQGVTSLTYGGTLQVTNVSGVLTNGQTFQLFSAASKTGAFSATNLPALSGGLAWNWDSPSGTLSVITGIAQTPTNITFSVSGGTLSLSWPASHLGWFAQSNSVALADTNFWFDIAGSETVTNLSYSIDGSLTNVFYRLHKP
ncbi:MAG: beta strand repeat-containing protein, partial [Verrucomicrobiota bacterium]